MKKGDNKVVKVPSPAPWHHWDEGNKKVYQLIAIGEIWGSRVEKRSTTVFLSIERASQMIDTMKEMLKAFPMDNLRIEIVPLEVIVDDLCSDYKAGALP